MNGEAIRIGCRVLAAIALCLAGCSTTTIRVREQRPAKSDLSRYQTIAVDALGGNGGADVAEDLTVALAGSGQFKVVDRHNVEKFLREQKFTRGDEWDPDTVVKLGQLAGAQALIHGRVSMYECREKMDTQRFQEKGKKNRPGEVHITITRQATSRVVCFFQVSDVSTGQIVVGDKVDKTSYRETYATDADPPNIDHELLLREAREAVIQDFMQTLAPHEVEVRLNVFADGDIPSLEQGNGFAETGDWERARECYQEALDSLTPDLEPYRYMPLFNMGVALTYLKRFDEAKKSLDEAYSLYPDRMIQDQLYQTKSYRSLWEGRGTQGQD